MYELQKNLVHYLYNVVCLLLKHERIVLHLWMVKGWVSRETVLFKAQNNNQQKNITDNELRLNNEKC